MARPIRVWRNGMGCQDLTIWLRYQPRRNPGAQILLFYRASIDEGAGDAWLDLVDGDRIVAGLERRIGIGTDNLDRARDVIAADVGQRPSRWQRCFFDPVELIVACEVESSAVTGIGSRVLQLEATLIGQIEGIEAFGTCGKAVSPREREQGA